MTAHGIRRPRAGRCPWRRRAPCRRRSRPAPAPGGLHRGAGRSPEALPRGWAATRAHRRRVPPDPDGVAKWRPWEGDRGGAAPRAPSRETARATAGSPEAAASFPLLWERSRTRAGPPDGRAPRPPARRPPRDEGASPAGAAPRPPAPGSARSGTGRRPGSRRHARNAPVARAGRTPRHLAPATAASQAGRYRGSRSGFLDVTESPDGRAPRHLAPATTADGTARRPRSRDSRGARSSRGRARGGGPGACVGRTPRHPARTNSPGGRPRRPAGGVPRCRRPCGTPPLGEAPCLRPSLSPRRIPSPRESGPPRRTGPWRAAVPGGVERPGAVGWRRDALPCSCTPRFLVPGDPARSPPGRPPVRKGPPRRLIRHGTRIPAPTDRHPGQAPPGQGRSPLVRVTLRVDVGLEGTSPRPRGICPERPPTLR